MKKPDDDDETYLFYMRPMKKELLCEKDCFDCEGYWFGHNTDYILTGIYALKNYYAKGNPKGPNVSRGSQTDFTAILGTNAETLGGKVRKPKYFAKNAKKVEKSC